MAKKERLRCTARLRREEVRAGEPLTWTVTAENVEATALHVSARIHSLNVSPDGRVIEVSTARPLLAETVTISVQDLPTTPVPPNQSVELDFQLTFPLRIARFTGERARAVVEEWTPQGEVEVRMTMAYGEQPFYPPADEGRLNDALSDWTKTVSLRPMRVRVEAPPGAPPEGTGGRKGE